MSNCPIERIPRGDGTFYFPYPRGCIPGDWYCSLVREYSSDLDYFRFLRYTGRLRQEFSDGSTIAPPGRFKEVQLVDTLTGEILEVMPVGVVPYPAPAGEHWMRVLLKEIIAEYGDEIPVSTEPKAEFDPAFQKEILSTLKGTRSPLVMERYTRMVEHQESRYQHISSWSPSIERRWNALKLNRWNFYQLAKAHKLLFPGSPPYPKVDWEDVLVSLGG